MKKLGVLFLFLTSLLKADYLISNGKINLFFDTKHNVLRNIGNTDFKKDIIANIQILFVKDFKIYNSMNYYTEVKHLDGINILKIDYYIEQQKITTYIEASNYDKDNILIYTDLKNVKWNDNYKIVYQITPMLQIGDIYNKGNYFSYGGINIAKFKGDKIISAIPEEFIDFKVKVLEDVLTKELDERIYLVRDITKVNRDTDLLSLNLNNTIPSKDDLPFNKRLAKEIEFWKEIDKRYYFLREGIVEQIKLFYMLSSRYENMNVVPEDEYLNYLKTIYIKNLLKKEKSPKIEISFNRKESVENIYGYYYYYTKILNLIEIRDKKDIKIDNSNIQKNIDETYRSILRKEGDWISNSFILYEFLEESEKEFKLNTEKNSLIKSKLKTKIEKEILDEKGLIKNIEYIKFIKILPKEIRYKNINYLLTKTNNSYLVLIEDNNIDYINSLELALLLYEEGLREESDKIFGAVGYLLYEQEKSAEISIKNLFLYIKNIYYRGIL